MSWCGPGASLCGCVNEISKDIYPQFPLMQIIKQPVVVSPGTSFFLPSFLPSFPSFLPLIVWSYSSQKQCLLKLSNFIKDYAYISSGYNRHTVKDSRISYRLLVRFWLGSEEHVKVIWRRNKRVFSFKMTIIILNMPLAENIFFFF